MMQEELWHVRRRRELEAAAPVKRKKSEPFVRVPLWWIRTAAKATRSPDILVLVELLYRSWNVQNATFLLPNARLEKWGASRKVKTRVLRDLERDGLIRVEWRERKSPRVTLIGV